MAGQALLPLVIGGSSNGPPPRQAPPTQVGRMGRPGARPECSERRQAHCGCPERQLLGSRGGRRGLARPGGRDLPNGSGAHAVWVLRGSGAERGLPLLNVSGRNAALRRLRGFGMKTPATSRRKRFYAYQRRSGGQCYFDKAMHAHLQRYPHTIGHYQLTRFLGTSALLTAEEAAAQGWMAKPHGSPA